MLEASSGVGGRYTCSGIAPEKVERRGGRGTIRNAIADFKAHPDKYVAMRYQTDMHDEDWEEQDCTLFLPPDQTIVVARVSHKRSGRLRTVLEWTCRPLRPDVEVKDDGHEKRWLQPYYT